MNPSMLSSTSGYYSVTRPRRPKVSRVSSRYARPSLDPTRTHPYDHFIVIIIILFTYIQTRKKNTVGKTYQAERALK